MDQEKENRYKQLMQLFAELKNIRCNYEAGGEAITRFCAPGRDFWSTVKESPTKPTNWIYDGTAMGALNLLANGLQGYMASKQTKSFKVGLQSFKTLQYQPYKGRMRSYMHQLDDVFYEMIDKSNFYQAANEAFQVGGSIATMVMFVDLVPDENELVNIVCHPNDVWIAENDVRIVDTVFRRIDMKAKDILRRWPSELDTQFVEQVRQNPYSTHEVIHAVLPRDTRDATKIDNQNKKYGSYWMLPEKQLLLDESGFDSNPYVIWRWSTPNSNTYGWGPAHEAMADIIRSNRMGKDIDDAASLFLYPALNVPVEAQGKLDLRPRGMNPYVDPSRVVTPIQQTGTYPIGIDREQSKQKAIRDHFFVDMFLMLNATSENGKRTATEVLEMQAEKAAIMGAITTRIESEFFDPLFDRYFEIASEQGWLPTPPPELYEMLDGSDIKIDYIGPMSQVQQRFYQKQSIDQPLQKLFGIAAYFPDVLDNIDGDELAMYIANESTLPQSVIRDEKKKAAIRQQRAKQLQAQADAQNNKLNAGAFKDMSQSDPDTLQKMMREQTGGAV